MRSYAEVREARQLLRRSLHDPHLYEGSAEHAINAALLENVLLWVLEQPRGAFFEDLIRGLRELYGPPVDLRVVLEEEGPEEGEGEGEGEANAQKRS